MDSNYHLIKQTLYNIFPESCYKYVKLMYNDKNQTYNLKTLKPISDTMNISIDELVTILDNVFDKELFETEHVKYSYNLKCTNINLTNTIKSILQSSNIINKTDDSKNILVDYASPNVCKDLHVGHLRSSIIGKTLCNVLNKLGHNVTPINHIGDWGTQFGMLIEHLDNTYENLTEEVINSISGNLQQFYTESKNRFNTDEEFRARALEKVVLLQSHDEDIIEKWKMLKEISRKSYQPTFDILGVESEEKGESFYQQFIPGLIEELEQNNMLEVQDDGRTVIRNDKYSIPLIIIKSDGGYTYDTTDLAALRYRLIDMNMDEIYYVVDGGDSHKFHFQMLFDVARQMEWLTYQKVEHIDFGFVKGSDGKIFRSRDGGTVKLQNLLDESINRMTNIMLDRNVDIDQEMIDEITRNIAIGSIKYSDLKTKRQKDYVFSFDRMLTFEGDSCPYLLYNLVRIKSIIRKINDINPEYVQQAKNNIINDNIELEFNDDYEKVLAHKMSQFTFVLDNATNKMEFHQLCRYMYDLSCEFSRFNKNCRIINFRTTETGHKIIESINTTRFMLCKAMEKIQTVCFEILGIDIVEYM